MTGSQLVNSKLKRLNREQVLLREMAAEKKKETDIKACLRELAALVASSLKRISFDNKQKLWRMVLDKGVVAPSPTTTHGTGPRRCSPPSTGGREQSGENVCPGTCPRLGAARPR